MRMLNSTGRALRIGGPLLGLVLILKGYNTLGFCLGMGLMFVGCIIDIITYNILNKRLRKSLDNLLDEVVNDVIKEHKTNKEENSVLDIHFERLSEQESTFDIKGNCSVEDMALVIIGVAKAAAKNSPLKPEEFINMAKEMYLENTKMLEK